MIDPTAMAAYPEPDVVLHPTAFGVGSGVLTTAEAPPRDLPAINFDFWIDGTDENGEPSLGYMRLLLPPELAKEVLDVLQKTVPDALEAFARSAKAESN